MLVARGF